MITSIQRSTLLLAIMLLAVSGPAFAQDFAAPGTCESVSSDCDGGAVMNKSGGLMPLTPYTTETGNIAVSVDAIGSNDPNGADIQVEKPSNAATVRAAYLMAVSTGFDGNIGSDVTISRGANTLTIAPGDYDLLVPGAISNQNGIVDVTGLIAGDLDPEPAGTYDYLIVESIPGILDGEVLVVIFDEPSAPSSSYVLTFGAQNIDGDNFNVTLGSPFNDTDVDITMSLGISFGFQPSGQFSIVEVNGERLTSSAGGQDNGEAANGALITAGGLGDDPANPPDPLANDDDGPRTDDELYTIDPFLDDGDTQINIFSQNPSNDDNMFFAGFLIRGTAAVIGEGILLTPPDDTNPVNTTHTVTAFLQDDNGDPVVGRDVDFEITSGPNTGLMATSATDGNGEATFSWMSASGGTDIVQASFIASTGQTLSTTAHKTWEEAGECDIPAITSETIDESNNTITLVFEDADGIAAVSYRYPADFPDPAKAGEPALDNLQVIDDGGLSSMNGIDFTAASPFPNMVTHVLQALGPGLVTYFPVITDACEDPEPQIYDADPVHAFARTASELPETLTLEGNYPNPFNPSTNVRFALPDAAEVSVGVFDILGRQVAILLEQASLSAGFHEVSFEAAGLPSGTYLVRIEAAGKVEIGRMTLLK